MKNTNKYLRCSFLSILFLSLLLILNLACGDDGESVSFYPQPCEECEESEDCEDCEECEQCEECEACEVCEDCEECEECECETEVAGNPTKLNDATYSIVTEYKNAFNNDGDGIALIKIDLGPARRIVYRIYDSNSGIWSEGGEFGTNINSFDIASNGTDFMVIYNQGSRLYARGYSSSGWGDKNLLNTNEYWAYNIKIHTNGMGYCAVWREYVQGSADYRLFSNIYDGVWLGYEQISDSVPVGNSIEISTNGTGYCVTWEDSDSGSDILANIYEAPAWVGETKIDDTNTGNYVGYPYIASNGIGYCITWQQYDGSSYYDIYANIYNGAWEGATEIDLVSGSEADDPQIASDGSGYCVAWEQYDGSNNIYANIYNGSWGGAIEIDLVSGGYAYRPLIASDGSGYCVTWGQYAVSEENIYANIYNGAWSGAAEIDEISGSDSDIYSTQIASNNSGYCILWQQNSSPDDRMYAKIYDSGSWGTSNIVDAGIYPDYSDPYLYSNNSGYHINWIESNITGNTAYTNTYSLSAWDGGIGIGSGEEGEGSCRTSHVPVVATNNSGNILALWSQFSLGDNNLYASENDGNGWKAPFVIAEDVEYFDVASNGTDFMIVYSMYNDLYSVIYNGALGTEVEIDSSVYGKNNVSIHTNGTGYCAVWSEWTEYSPGLWDNRVFSNIYDGGWQGDEQISESDPGYNLIRISTNGTGYCVIWEDNDSSTDIYANIYEALAWGGETKIDNSNPGNNVNDPEIASNGSGYCITWEQYDGSNYYDVYYNQYDGGWGVSTLIPDDPGLTLHSVYNPKIASNNDGYCITWSHQDDTYNRNIYAYSYNGLTWDPLPTEIDADIEDAEINYYAYSPEISSDGSGYCVVWRQYDDSPLTRIYARIYDGGWSAEATKLNPGLVYDESPQVISNGNSYLVFWLGYHKFNNSLFGSYYSGGSWGEKLLLETNDGDIHYNKLITESNNGLDYVAVWFQEEDDDPLVYNIWGNIITP
ncbi:MAG: hypothetical protein SVZ03_01540 [Spirochaetota bacterium]|nr:hypothetical protein [Spirochaetota bacterium]